MRSVEFAVGCVGVALVLVGLAMAGPQRPTLIAQTRPIGLQAAERAIVPEKAKRAANPLPASAESIEQGKTIFASQCTMCHGVLGSGKGDLVERLGLEMPDFTDPAMQRQRTDGELHWIILNGHNEMPAQQKRFDDETWWNVVNYIRTLEGKR